MIKQLYLRQCLIINTNYKEKNYWCLAALVALCLASCSDSDDNEPRGGEKGEEVAVVTLPESIVDGTVTKSCGDIYSADYNEDGSVRHVKYDNMTATFEYSSSSRSAAERKNPTRIYAEKEAGGGWIESYEATDLVYDYRGFVKEYHEIYKFGHNIVKESDHWLTYSPDGHILYDRSDEHSVIWTDAASGKKSADEFFAVKYSFDYDADYSKSLSHNIS